MRVAVISDIHANLHALEAVLAALDADPPGRAVVPRRPRRLRAEAERVLRARRARVRRVCLCREPRPRRARERSTSPSSAATPASRPRWTRDVLSDERARVPRRPRAARRTRDGVALFHGSARDPVWEYVLSDEAARATLAADRGATRARRPQPRRAAGLARETDGSTAGSRRTAPSSSSQARAGCSTPARSASRATATRGPRSSCSTSMRDRARSAASPTTSSGRRRRCATPGFPSCSPSGWRSGSEAMS